MKAFVLPRLFGLLLVAVASGATWWGIWGPLQAAVAQEPHVRYDLKVFVLVPFAAVFGLFLVMFGSSIPYRNTQRHSPTTAGLVLLLIAGAASGGCYWWAKSRFEALGYAYSGADPVRIQKVEPPPIPRPPSVPQPKFSSDLPVH
ncbi:MAG: hypothetical protein R3E09_07620 [Novosphingobium sp.]|nr:hypothetical protein [Novosphingobium sp.]